MKKNIYRTTSLVTAFSIVERTLGFLYRILLSRLIGAEGIGLYQVALSVFAVFATLGTGGIPATVSRLTSKNKARGDRFGEHSALSAGLFASLIFTLPVLLLFPVFGKKLTFLFSDERAVGVFAILLLGLVFTSLYAVIRGSFWGNKKFLLTSALELIEEAVMVIVGVLLLKNVQSGYFGAKRAAIAVVVSYLVSFSSSLVCYFSHGGKIVSPSQELKPLFSSAMPITAVRVSGSATSSLISVLLPMMLIRAGKTKVQALRLFGIVSGMVMPILSIPATIVGSVSLVLFPELSEDYYRGRNEHLKKNVERGIFAAVVIACCLMPFFIVLGNDVGRCVYSEPLAGEMISRCAYILLPMSISMITSGVMNSLGNEKRNLLYYLLGSVFTLLCVVLLPKKIGVYAYPVGICAGFVFTAIFNVAFLAKHCHLSRSLFFRSLLPILLCLFATGFALALRPLFVYRVSVLLSVLFSVLSIVLFVGISLLLFLCTKKNRKNTPFQRKCAEK